MTKDLIKEVSLHLVRISTESKTMNMSTVMQHSLHHNENQPAVSLYNASVGLVVKCYWHMMYDVKWLYGQIERPEFKAELKWNYHT